MAASMSSTPMADRVATWRHALSPWIACLESRLFFCIDYLPNKDAIERHLWIRLIVPNQPESTLVQAIGDVNRSWCEWLEALELLDLLTRVDSAVCWTIIHELCDSVETLTRHGCPVEFFNGVQPQYELSFAHTVIPTDDIMALVLNERPAPPTSSAFSLAKAVLLAALPSGNLTQLSPIRLRFQFGLPTRQFRQYRTTAHDSATAHCLKRALVLATQVSDVDPRRTSRFVVRAFGFRFPPDEVIEGARDLLLRIATLVPIFDLAYGTACRQRRHLRGPFVWRLLRPHAAPQSLLGVRKLSLLSRAVHANDIPAVTAAIAQSHSLRELMFVDVGATRWGNDRQWTAFLCFALFRKNASHHIHTVHLSLHHSNVAAMARVLKEENPITYLYAVQNVYALDEGYSRPPPTTMLVNPHARIVYDHTSKVPAVQRLSDGVEDVECYVAGQDQGDVVRVLAPGIGFCSVLRSDIRSETPLMGTRLHPVRSLTLRVNAAFEVTAVASLLASIGEPLTELTLMNVGERIVEPVSLDTMLVSCPRLQRLKLSRVTLSIKTLIPNGWGRDLESLRLRSCEILHGPNENPINLIHPPAFPAFLLKLAIARDVHRLVVLCDDPILQETYRVHMQQHNGDRIRALPERHKLAVLSVVSPTGSNAKYQLNSDVLTLIFGMVAPTIRTRICTLVD